MISLSKFLSDNLFVLGGGGGGGGAGTNEKTGSILVVI